MASSADLGPLFILLKEDDISAFNSSPILIGAFLNAVIMTVFLQILIFVCIFYG